MKAPVAFAMVIIIAAGALAGVYLYDQFKASPSPVSTSPLNCRDPASISSHVYHPQRLLLVEPCVTASGMVDDLYHEPDGDVHILLALDPPYRNLTNSGNDQQNGDLVVEIICVDTPTQTDAIPACQGYTNQIPVPGKGERITVTGRYVLDTNHYRWAEIHPVYSLVQPSLTTGVSISGYVLNISYPDSSAYGWLGPTPRSYPTNVTVSGGDQFTDTLSLYSTSSSSQNVTSIEVATPGFSLLSISPNLPITFGANETLSITLTILPPDTNFNGAISLHIVTS